MEDIVKYAEQLASFVRLNRDAFMGIPFRLEVTIHYSDFRRACQVLQPQFGRILIEFANLYKIIV